MSKRDIETIYLYYVAVAQWTYATGNNWLVIFWVQIMNRGSDEGEKEQ